MCRNVSHINLLSLSKWTLWNPLPYRTRTCILVLSIICLNWVLYINIYVDKKRYPPSVRSSLVNQFVLVKLMINMESTVILTFFLPSFIYLVHIINFYPNVAKKLVTDVSVYWDSPNYSHVKLAAEIWYFMIVIFFFFFDSLVKWIQVVGFQHGPRSFFF